MIPIYKTGLGKQFLGDSVTVLKQLPAESVNCVITSPPYWALRDYKVKGQIGLEESINLYIDKLMEVFVEVKRVLANDGTCFVNLGDTYSGNKSGNTLPAGFDNKRIKYDNRFATDSFKKIRDISIPNKSLCQIPERFSIAMTDRLGWLKRNTIIWNKLNCLPSSQKDRFTVDFEPVYFYVKNEKYFFEQQREPQKKDTLARYKRAVHADHKNMNIPGQRPQGLHRARAKGTEYVKWNDDGRNKRCVWAIPSQAFSEAHYAIFPEKLVVAPLKAGCPKYICKKCGHKRKKIYKGKTSSAFNVRVRDVKAGRIKSDSHIASKEEIFKYDEKQYHGSGKKFVGYTKCKCNAGFESGVVMDPFHGSGTVGLVAEKLGYHWLGIDLSPEYCKIIKKRIDPEAIQGKLL